jgi:hypothetical protein
MLLPGVHGFGGLGLQLVFQKQQFVIGGGLPFEVGQA